MKHVELHRRWNKIQLGGLGLILMLSTIIHPIQGQSFTAPLKSLLEGSEIGRHDPLSPVDLYNFILAHLHHSISTDLNTLRHSSLPPAWSLADIPCLDDAEGGNGK